MNAIFYTYYRLYKLLEKVDSLDNYFIQTANFLTKLTPFANDENLLIPNCLAALKINQTKIPEIKEELLSLIKKCNINLDGEYLTTTRFNNQYNCSNCFSSYFVNESGKLTDSENISY